MSKVEINRYKNSKGQIWLNVASGHFVIDDFINLDNSFQLRLLFLYPLLRGMIKKRKLLAIRFEEYLEAKKKDCHLLIHNCIKPLNVPDNSVDHILASHFIEHLYKEEAIVVLKYFLRILKPGGTLHIIVPNLESRALAYTNNLGAPDAADRFMSSLSMSAIKKPHILTRFLEFVGGFGLFHKWMYDDRSMKQLVRQAGFDISDFNNSPSAHWRMEDSTEVNFMSIKPGVPSCHSCDIL